MTTPTIHTLRTRLGLTTGALARLVGVERRTAQRWFDGSQDVPEPARRLLAVAADQPAALEQLRTMADTERTPDDRQDA